jgi:hypothetical protein
VPLLLSLLILNLSKYLISLLHTGEDGDTDNGDGGEEEGGDESE